MPGVIRINGDRPEDYGQILGKLICDRLGLDPHHVIRDDFRTELLGAGGAVGVFTSQFHTLTREDYEELRALAHERFMAGPVG